MASCVIFPSLILVSGLFVFSFAEPITAFPGENFYFPGKTALLSVYFSFCWHGLLHGRKAVCVLVRTANVLSGEIASVC